MLDTSEENDVVGLPSLPKARKAWSDFVPVDCATASTALTHMRANRVAAKGNAGLIGYNTQFTHFCPIGNFRLGIFTEIIDLEHWTLPIHSFPCPSRLVPSLFSTNGSNPKVCESIVTRLPIR